MQALVAAMLLAGAGDAPAAMALKAGDGATVQEGAAAARPLRDGDMVPAGAAVTAGKGDVLLFLRGNGTAWQIKAGEKAVVGEARCTPAAVQLKRRGVSAAQLESIGKLMGERGGVGSLRRGPPGGKAGAGIWPLHTSNVATLRPSFRWEAVDGADFYEVRFYSGEEGGFHKEWFARTTKPALTFPEKAAALSHGLTRNWEVWVKKKGKEALEPVVLSAWFGVLEEGPMKDAAAVKELADGKETADWLLAGVAYESLGLYGEALEQYLKVDKARPDQVEVLKGIELCHRLARDTAKVKEARARLAKLGVKFKDKE